MIRGDNSFIPLLFMSGAVAPLSVSSRLATAKLHKNSKKMAISVLFIYN